MSKEQLEKGNDRVDNIPMLHVWELMEILKELPQDAEIWSEHSAPGKTIDDERVFPYLKLVKVELGSVRTRSNKNENKFTEKVRLDFAYDGLNYFNHPNEYDKGEEDRKDLPF